MWADERIAVHGALPSPRSIKTLSTNHRRHRVGSPFSLVRKIASGAGSASRAGSASAAGSGTRKKNTPVAGAAISRSMDSLPNEAGQVWREYDISSYTSKVTSVDNPQQAVLDWVLRETGNEMWFNEPLGILHATKSRLIVYHTPEIQSAVKDIVDRFVRTRGQLQSFNINLVTIGNPNWRAAAGLAGLERECGASVQPIEKPNGFQRTQRRHRQFARRSIICLGKN